MRQDGSKAKNTAARSATHVKVDVKAKAEGIKKTVTCLAMQLGILHQRQSTEVVVTMHKELQHGHKILSWNKKSPPGMLSTTFG